jgi:hypothetical protein
MKRRVTSSFPVELHRLHVFRDHSDLSTPKVPHQGSSARIARSHPQKIPHGPNTLGETVGPQDDDIEQAIFR